MDLVIAGSFLGISIPIWDTYATRLPDVQINDADDLVIFPADDFYQEVFSIKKANDEYPQADLIIHNFSSRTQTGKLIFKYCNTSSLDYKNLNIVLNGVSYHLDSFLMSTSGTYVNFILDSVTVDPHSSLDYQIGMSIDNRVSKDTFKQKFNYNLEIVIEN